MHSGAEEGRGQALPHPWEVQRPRQARAWMSQAHGKARRVDRRVCTRREKGDAAQGVRRVREGRCRHGPGISVIVRPGGRRPGRMYEIRALQVEARAAWGGDPDVRRPPQQACAAAGKAACDPGGHRRSRGQEGRARGRARGARAQARHHGGRPRDSGKRDGRRPGKRAHEQGEDPADRVAASQMEAVRAPLGARDGPVELPVPAGSAPRPRQGRGGPQKDLGGLRRQ